MSFAQVVTYNLFLSLLQASVIMYFQEPGEHNLAPDNDTPNSEGINCFRFLSAPLGDFTSEYFIYHISFINFTQIRL